jgi:hypothetical protein
MLVPPDFKAYAPERQRLALMLDSEAAALPWELLRDAHDRGSRPLSVETGMVRQLLLGPALGSRRPEASGNRVLVIGNPHVSDPRFRSLPGATAEADVVAACLAGFGGEPPTRLVETDASPEAVLDALHDPRCWRILHIASHGVYRFSPSPGAPPETGVVLDDGVFLSPAQFAKMRRVPELVFVNCCYLGKEPDEQRRRTRFHHLAANVGEQFIALGARVVIAAGWAVDDAAARDFAEVFYTTMLAGRPFGEAVRTARQQVYAEHPGTNTWGAYQCYGDPAYTLRPESSGEASRSFVCARELVVAIDNLAAEVASSTITQDAELGSRLARLLDQSPEDWQRDPTVSAALGRTYGALGDFERAIACYGGVASAERTGGLTAIEQQANLMGRRAAEILRRTAVSPEDEEAAKALFAGAEKRLKALNTIAETAERKALLGSLHKRQALVRVGAERQKSLVAMVEAYRGAADMGRPNRWYPLLNAVAGMIVESWGTGPKTEGWSDRQQAIEKGVGELEDIAVRQDASGCDFWEAVFRADLALLKAIWEADLEDSRVDQIVKGYGDALRRGREVREQRSVLDQIGFLVAMAHVDAPGGAHRISWLRRIEGALAARVGVSAETPPPDPDRPPVRTPKRPRSHRSSPSPAPASSPRPKKRRTGRGNA